MTTTNIATASVLPRLRGILNDDIAILNSSMVEIEDDELVDFLSSLVSAKEDILTYIPSDESDINQGSPNVPQKDHLTGLQVLRNGPIDNQVKFLKQILQSEESQSKMVKSATDTKGVPEDLKQILIKISKKYFSIEDQIGRSIKTQQLGSIAIA